MAIKVAIAGISGYAGGEIARLLLNHPKYASGQLEIGALTGNSNAGQRLGDIVGHIPQLADRIVEETTAEVFAGHDVVFLGLPHGHSAKVAKQLPAETIVIDSAADFRLNDATAWEEYYGSEHAGSWPYGIPELPGNREVLAKAKNIAVPGCFPTGATLAALPAVAAGLVKPELVVTSVTGVSGAGKKANVAMLGAETMNNLKAYSVAGAHRHTPEMEQNLSQYCDSKVSVSFTPVLAPLPRGILSTVVAPIVDGVDQSAAYETYRGFYAEEAFVHVLPEGQQPQTQHVYGSNSCHVQVTVNERARKLVMTSAIDNLTKGTSGASIQCMNIALGWEETAGLAIAGVAP